MKNHKIGEFLNNYRFKIATLVVFFVFASLMVISVNDIKVSYAALITTSAAIATIYYGLIKYWIDEDLMFKSFFEVFNQRFEAINRDLNAIMRGEDPENDIKKVMQDYLNLCAEEYYWFKKNRIPKVVWLAWLNGIHYYLKSDIIKAYFKEELELDSSYYGFLISIEKSLT